MLVAYSAKVPENSCWPSPSQWDALNTSISGKLVDVQPVAVSCYPGALFNIDTCADVSSKWDNCAWQAEQPAGLCQEADDLKCPLVVPPAVSEDDCTNGNEPRYAVNATAAGDVAAAIQFAKDNNIRLVIKTTGHDFLRRSQGFGSLLVWMRYYRTGLDFQQTFQSSCSEALNWKGSALKIGGGYQWSDVYAVAAANNVIVVGGGAPSIGAIGGWLQGGGYGPATHQYGIGADQLLEAEVALADGSIVIANTCQNSDVWSAIRGGGPSTYGVVLSATFKAYPNVGAVGQKLSFDIPSTNSSAFMNAMAVLYSSLPDLIEEGFTVFGHWGISNVSLIGSAPPGYFHNAYMINRTVEEAQAVFSPVQQKLAAFGLNITQRWASYDDYWALFNNVSGGDNPGFPIGVIYSRFMDKTAMQDNPSDLLQTLDTLAGAPGDSTRLAIECMSGGKVFEDANDRYSSAHPAWRSSYCLQLVQRGWPPDADKAFISAVKDDVTSVKGGALIALAPDTGTYMNEAGWEDPNWKDNFYGSNYPRLLDIKKQRDPGSVFYCPTCVGSDEWVEDESGRLCRV
ncbi:uncharacterized protein CCOS01_13170 [Colletotrichum costaricense]|uniref:FAD-binding PCMH-type domain-containing protein n=1 Tax=Colletotrichum costaricense TaxID=1209916 RepID=A0AAJ0DW90_9PEZI|nr:uncharacterized protein CCOS01_13170 [Colletotrichum costaricense]KAK1515972.1 hypothetical protein CCOS01_13170 [Colletotrichum costaricense]